MSILITGATGNNGTEIIRQLASAGRQVSGMVRKVPPTDRQMANVTYVVGDFDDAKSVQLALEGIESVFLVTNSSEKAEQQQLQFVAAASSAGVRHIVYLSQLHAASDSKVRFLRYHANVEEALAASGMAFTNLRPNLYMQGLLMFRDLIAAKGVISAPIDDSKVSLVDVRDIAAVAAIALTTSGHEGKSYDLTGPEALSHAEIAHRLGNAMRRSVKFVTSTPQQMREALGQLGTPKWQLEGLIEDYCHYDRGEAAGISDAVHAVTGGDPRSFSEFASDYAEQFKPIGTPANL